MAGAKSGDERPLSPHLQVWKPHATMLASISHRITGMALYFGTFLIAVWIVALGTAPEAGKPVPVVYSFIEGLIATIPGQIILVAWAAAVLFHFANGIRHLLWDGPRIGFDPKVASAVSVFNFVFAILGAIALWAAATLL